MRKYVNGKIIEMTEKDIAKAKRRFGNRVKSTSDYEKRVKELENIVADLQTKLNETKNV